MRKSSENMLNKQNDHLTNTDKAWELKADRDLIRTSFLHRKQA